MARASRPYRQQHPAVSRDQRVNAALRPDSVDIDGRDADQLLAFLRGLAPTLRFPTADGRELDWSGLFDALGDGSFEQLRNSAGLAPHAALLLTFIELYQHARQQLNQLSGRHLDFYFREVLGLRPRPPRPDRVHLLFEPSRNRGSVRVPAQTALKAGEHRYQTRDELFADDAAITRLHSVYHDPIDARLRYALAADSADGLGAGLDPDSPSWPAFGHHALPVMPVGFAIAGPVLMLAEGERNIKLRLELALDPALDPAPVALSSDLLLAGLEVELSGADAWIGPLRPLAASLDPGDANWTLSVELQLGESDEAVVLYDPTRLPGGFAASAPVMKVQLRADASPALYATLAPARVVAMSVQVAVSGVTDLRLENDLGRLNADKPFMPFGPQPAKGSSFYIGSPETFAKRLDDYSLHLQWQDVPGDLSSHYRAYLKGKKGLKKVDITASAASVVGNRKVQGNDHFSATMQLIRSGSRDDGIEVTLFDGTDARLPHQLDSNPAAPLAQGASFLTMQAFFTTWAPSAQVQFPLASTTLSSPLVGGLSAPALSFLPALNGYPLPLLNGIVSLRQQRRLGYIQLRLNNSFLHRQFPYLFSAAAIDNGSDLTPNPPYTPVLESISMDYNAHSGRVEPGSVAREDYEARALQLFHLTPFGQAEEHGWLKQGLAHVTDYRARLLPPFDAEGSLLIGLQNARPGTDLNLLMQVAEGSANPRKRRRELRWSLLSGNHWRPFEPAELRRDQTNQLLRSGRVSLRLPTTPPAANTALDPTLTWLRVSVASDSDAVCRLIGIHSQAGEAELSAADTATDPAHLASALPAGSVSKLLRQQAGIKAVSQPYASFGGRPAESADAFATRTAERLRHRHRGVSRWDYERLTLAQFPQLHSVKLLSHTSPDSAEAPGHVTVVAVPDIRNRNAYDPLQPRTDLDTLSSIEDYLQRLCPPGIQIHAVNPDYEQLRLDISVRFGAAYPFGPYRDILNLALQRRLSPWAFDDGGAPGFGGRLHASELLQFVAALDYVDRVEQLGLLHLVGDNPPRRLDEVAASGAASVLVSHPQHLIRDADAAGAAS